MNTANLDPGDGTALSRSWTLKRASDALRLVIAGLLLVGGPTMGLGREAPSLFFFTAACYLAVAVALTVWPSATLVAAHKAVAAAVVDALAFAALLATSGGFASGLPTLLFVLVVVAALEAVPKIALFHAAVAALALLGENLWRLWQGWAATDPFLVGAAGGALFVAAWLAQRLGTRLRQTEAAHQAQQALLAWQRTVNDRIVQELADGVLWVDAQGVVRYASPRVVAWLGEDPSDKPLTEVLPEPIHPGEERWWRQNGRLWRLKGGMPDRNGVWLLFLSDFAGVQRAFRQERLASLGLLLAGVAHEVRNPLAGVMQALDLLRDAATSSERGELVALAERNAARIVHLIDEVLLLGRQQPPNPEAVPLVAWLRRWCSELPKPEQTRVSVQGSDAIAAWVDVRHLQTIVDNLVRNALAFASAQPGAVQVTVSAANEQVCLTVADDGPGVADELAERLFEPFVSGRANGTGLGLYLVHELVRVNGGEVRCRRGPKGGAVFTVLLPQAARCG
ncbi:MAG TPA: ATP-binding protein [Hydrogenophilus thermoluteolus]|nr:ATP-binding protein [Hydrogenophilus thermoluteolus]